jgi:Inorganic Pyrophosphatase
MADDFSDEDIGLSDDEISGGPAPAQARGGLSDADIGMSDEEISGGNDQSAGPKQRPTPETPLVSGVRGASRNVIPGIIGSALGGAVAGAIGGPVGAVAGLATGIAGAVGTSYAQSKVKDALGLNDDDILAADAEANPISTGVGEFLGAMATGSPFGVGKTIAQKVGERALSGGIAGGLETANEAWDGEPLSPGKIAANVVGGALLPGQNRVGKYIHGKIDAAVARPGSGVDPATGKAHSEDQDIQSESLEGSSLGGTPDTTIAQSELRDGGNDGRYSKNAPAKAADPGSTSGQIPDDQQAALSALNPDPVPPATPPSAPQPAAPPAAASGGRRSKTLSLPPKPANLEEAPQPGTQPPDMTFPKEGEMQAAGANDVPVHTPEQQAAADALVQEAGARAVAPAHDEALAAVAKEHAKNEAPEIKGETPINDSVTDAQKAAGNYEKAYGNDFGKPFKIETHTGDTRRSKATDTEKWEVKSPYEYGYFNKTLAPDGDHIDFARPRKDAPEFGDKHFIIDQKDAKTGKYDEPKVFSYFKDKETAVDAYNRGFSDGKGPDRMHDITEVDRGQLVNYLRKHAKSAPTKPFGKPMPPVVITAAVTKLREAGKPELADAIMKMPEEQRVQAAAKAEAALTNKTGGVKDPTKQIVPRTARKRGIVEGLTKEDGSAITTGTQTEAAERSARHKDAVRFFEEAAPPTQLKPDDETNPELLRRLKAAVGKFDYKAGWTPSFKPREWLWAREAHNLLRDPAPANVKKFREAERDLRGSPEDVDRWRKANRAEADRQRGKTGGDEAVSAQENRVAAYNPSAVEDKLIADIDAKKLKEKLDVPHEEAETMVEPKPVKTAADLKELPRKTVDLHESSLARKAEVDAIMSKAKENRAAERLAKAEATKAENAAKEEARTAGAAYKERPKVNSDEMKRLTEMLEQAKKKGNVKDAYIAGEEPPPAERPRKRDMAGLLDDESASLNPKAIKDSFKAGAAKLKNMWPDAPDRDSYLAKPARGKLEKAARDLMEDVHQVNNDDTMHRNGLLKWGNELPKEATPEVLKNIYRAREADSAHVDLPNKTAKTNVESLTGTEKKIWEDHIAPMMKDNNELFDLIRHLQGDKEMGPAVEHHISRIQHGDTPEYNMLRRADDPTGPQYNGLKVDSGFLKNREFFALENPKTGERHVIQTRPDGITKWEKFKGEHIKGNIDFAPNEPVKIGNNKYIMREAMAEEIMAHARGRDGTGKTMKYYQNAALSAAMTNAQLGSVARHLQAIERLINSPLFEENATRSHNEGRAKDWVETNHPNFKGWYMEPQLAHVLDDYARPGFHGTPNFLRDLNQGVTKLLFWMPTAHIANVGAHWFVGRGFDNFTPKGIKSTFVDGAKAIRSVMKQDAYQQRMQENGAGLIYPSVKARNFVDQIADHVGESIVREPGKWGPVADKMGVTLGQLKDAIYNTSSKVMWAANDVFLTQRVMELERKGMSMQSAIRKTEKDIPNYRLPTTIMGDGAKGRFLQKWIADPTTTAFGRYHFGMFNSYANIVREAIGKGATGQERVDAVGKMVAMGVLAFAVYPMLDAMWKAMTGNKDASAQRRGPIAVPSHLVSALKGKEDITSPLRSTLSVPPLMQTGIETYQNRDFRGKQIVEPGDVGSGKPKRIAKAALQEADHAAAGLVSPYGTVNQAVGKMGPDEKGPLATGKAIVKAVRNQALDVKEPSPGAIKYDRLSDMYNQRNANQRARKGGYGMGERLFNKAFGNN